MTPSFEILHDRFQESLESFLWDQWIAIGVAGASPNRTIPFVVDPEALFLATTQFAKHDSRLMEEVLDWILQNGDLLNLSRLKNVHVGFQIGSTPVIRALATHASDSAQPSWKKLRSFGTETSELSPPWLKDLQTRGMSYQPDPDQVPSFLFRMRALFGWNARPEILTWLLTHPAGHPARIARETSWFSKSVQAALNEMSRSGLVDSRTAERRKEFRVVDRERWTDLLHPDEELSWFAQGAFYLTCAHLTHTLQRLAESNDASPELQSIIIRERFVSTLKALESAGIGESWRGERQLTGEEMVAWFRETVEKVMAIAGWTGENVQH